MILYKELRPDNEPFLVVTKDGCYQYQPSTDNIYLKLTNGLIGELLLSGIFELAAIDSDKRIYQLIK